AHERPLSLVGDEVDRSETINQTLRKFVEQAGDLKNVRACVGVAGQRVLGRFFDLPPMDARKVASAVVHEARHQLPIALEDLCWSHCILDQAAEKQADQQPRRILVQAARETLVRDQVNRFKEAGVPNVSVQSDCLALHNWLLYEFFQG